MRKSLTALIAATTIALAAIVTPTTADAQWRRGGWGWGPALGGFAVGALIGSAFARPYYAYPAYGYGYGYPAYSYAPVYAPAYAPAYRYPYARPYAYARPFGYARPYRYARAYW